jgi:hypothetical protein
MQLTVGITSKTNGRAAVEAILPGTCLFDPWTKQFGIRSISYGKKTCHCEVPIYRDEAISWGKPRDCFVTKNVPRNDLSIFY